MMYLTPDESYWSCDIEADNLRNEATRIWCVCVENILTDEALTFRSTESFQEWYNKTQPVLVGHNFLAYDAPVLNRLWNVRIPANAVIDTFVLSQVYSPNIKSGHSLRAWGERLGNEKLEHSDFSKFSKDMLGYCQQDTSLTKAVYKALVDRLNKESFREEGIQLEHQAWNIIQNKQKQNGFPFNIQQAEELYAELRSKEAALKTEIYKLWPAELKRVRVFAKHSRADGRKTAGYIKHLKEYESLEIHEDGTYSAYDFVEFDLGSPKQRIEKLLDLGWEPVNFTLKGSPKIDEDELIAFADLSGTEEVRKLAEWCVINARANMIKTWLGAVNPKTESIHGNLFIASTLRYKHSRPNTANIPSSETVYGAECRSLWWSGGEDWSLVGVDGKSMQSRCLAHNVARMVGVSKAKEFIDDLLVGDLHKKNMKRFGFPTKPASKKAYYTILMGGGGGKIAQDQFQFGWKLTASQGEELRYSIIRGIPGFAELISYLQAELVKTRRITLCSGNRVFVPSDHMVIPYLLQGDESQIMKLAGIYADYEIRRSKMQNVVFKVGDIHDEHQYRVKKGYESEFIDLVLPCFTKAGERFGYNIPIEGDAKIGNNWAETH